MNLNELPTQVQLAWDDPLSWQTVSTSVLASGRHLLVERMHYYDGKEQNYYRWCDVEASRCSEQVFTCATEAEADRDRYLAQQYPSDHVVAVLI